MADFVFDYMKGCFTEKFNDGASNGIVALLKTAQADATLKTYATLATLLAAGGGTANVEADFTNSGRKTGLTGTVVVDTVNHWSTVSLPNQTWTAAGGATNNTLAKALTAYQDSAADSGRIPGTGHDFVVTTDGSDLTIQFPATGPYKAA